MSQDGGAENVDPNSVARRLSEVRPMASASRVLTGVLAELALLSSYGQTPQWVHGIVLGYIVWALFSLWRELTGRGDTTGVAYFAVVVLLFALLMRGTENGGLMLPAIAHPMIMLSLLHGWRWGTAIAVIALALLLLEVNPWGINLQLLPAALGMALLVPASLLAARPVAALRRRLVLSAQLERDIDPRRGVQAVGLAVAPPLRLATEAQRVIICHRNAEQPTVVVCDEDEAAYLASPALAERVLKVLGELPLCAMTLDTQRTDDKALSCDDPSKASPSILNLARQLASLLDTERLQMVPAVPVDRADAGGRHAPATAAASTPGPATLRARPSWVLVAYGSKSSRSARPWPLRPLAAMAVDVGRLLTQAAYVDILQAEIAAHERARIGRDLHDSALQPYLGLKFAIEGLAMNTQPSNPLHAQVQDLRQFCDDELTELRETVSALRAGETRGENTLIPALRRQAARFGELFGIHTMLDLPAELPTNRATSAAVLHMVNEAINNVRRHTRGQQVWVKLRLDSQTQPARLHLMVRDDAGQRIGQPAPEFQPRSLTERAQELGGTLEVRRDRGLDTEIHITVPI